jgi:hypothetical protein
MGVSKLAVCTPSVAVMCSVAEVPTGAIMKSCTGKLGVLLKAPVASVKTYGGSFRWLSAGELTVNVMRVFGRNPVPVTPSS